jgi:hypothetical protein
MKIVSLSVFFFLVFLSKAQGSNPSFASTQTVRELMDSCRELLKEKAHALSQNDLLSQCSTELARQKISKADPVPSTSNSGPELGDILMFPVSALYSGISGISKATTWLIGSQKNRNKLVSDILSDELLKINSIKEILKDSDRELPHQTQATAKKLATEITSEVLQKTKGSLPSEDDFYRPTTLKIGRLTLQKSLKSMGYNDIQLNQIIDIALKPVENCFDSGKTPAQECSELFSNGAPYLVTNALLKFELESKLGGTLDPQAIKEFSLVAENMLAQCTADKYTKKDSLEKRTQISQSCLFYTFTKLFPDIATAEIYSKLKQMDSSMTHLKSDTENESYARSLVQDFLKYRTEHQNPKCTIKSSELKDYQNLKPQADFWRQLTQCTPQGFLQSVGSWTEDITDYVGERVVSRVVQKHPSIPIKLLQNNELKPEILNSVIELSYNECRKHQKDTNPNAAFAPEKCTQGIELVTKLILSTEAVLAELAPTDKSTQDNKWPEAIKHVKSTYSRCAPRIIKESLARPSTEAYDMNHFILNNSAMNCLSAALKPVFEQYAERALMDKITSTPDLARYFSGTPDEIRQKLFSRGIIQSVRETTAQCMLEGIESFSIDSLQTFLKTKQTLCSQAIEDKVAPTLAKEINNSIFDSLIDSKDPKRENKERQFHTTLSKSVMEFDNHSRDAYDKHNQQFANRFGLERFPKFNNAKQESEYLSELDSRVQRHIKESSLATFKARSNYKDSLMLDISRFAIKDQLDNQFGDDSAMAKTMHSKIDEQVVGLLGEIKDTQNRIVELENKGHSAATLKKILKKQELEFEAQVRHVATRNILEQKIKDVIASKSPRDAQKLTDKIIAEYDSCIEVFSSEFPLTAIKPMIRKSHPTNIPADYSVLQPSQVDSCRNSAISRTIWTTLNIVVEKTLQEHIPGEAANLKLVPTPINCPVFVGPGSSVSMHLSAFKCQESELNKCFAKHSADKKVADICSSKSVFEVSKQFATLVLETNLRKYIGADNLELFNKTNISGSLSTCVEPVRNSTQVPQIETHFDACVGVEIIRITQIAAKNSLELYSTLQNKVDKNASQLAWADFTKCFDKTLGELTGQNPPPPQAQWARIFIQKKLSSQDIISQTAACGEKLAGLIQDNVMSGFSVANKNFVDNLHKELDLSAFEQIESTKRIGHGLKEMTSILKTLNKYSNKNGPAAPVNEVDENLKLLNTLVTESCTYDPNCVDKLKDLHSAVNSAGQKSPSLDSKRFKAILMNSKFFDSVILARIQLGLRSALTKELKTQTTKQDAPFVDEMIRYLSSSQYLNNRFLSKQSKDRHGNSVKSANALIEKAKKDIIDFYINNNKSSDPNSPEFQNKLTDQVKSFLVDDWEFLAGLFYSFAQSQIKQSDFPWYATPVAWWKGWNKDQEFDWFNKVSRTQAGCSIIKMMRFYVQECFSGREMPILNKSSFVKLYEEGVSQSLDKKYINTEECLNKVRIQEEPSNTNKSKTH